jgi:hypothetical protein
MITATFQNSDRRVVEFIRSRAPLLRESISREMLKQMILLSAHVATDHLSGRPGLRNITGTLRRSVLASPRVSEGSNSISGTVSADPSVPYARIQEYGGTVQIPELIPKRKLALANVTSGWGPYRRARAHAVTIPERSFMRSSLRESQAAIVAGLNAAVAQAARS